MQPPLRPSCTISFFSDLTRFLNGYRLALVGEKAVSEIMHSEIENRENEVSPATSHPKTSAFMLRLLRGKLSVEEIEAHLVQPIDRCTVAKLSRAALREPPSIRRRAQAVLLRYCGFN